MIISNCYNQYLINNNSNVTIGSPKVEYLMYVENGRSGTMRRSGMDVDLRHFNLTLPLYKVFRLVLKL